MFSEIIQLPNGMSKGCGCVQFVFTLFHERKLMFKSCRIVEFATREEAERAVTELNEGQLMGRPVFLREVRIRSPFTFSLKSPFFNSLVICLGS